METVCTIIPAITLVFIPFPSLKLLYLMDEIVEPVVTVKAVGHQWYWSYEYSDYQTTFGENSTLEFDPYIIHASDLEPCDIRVLDIDNRKVVPIDTHVRVLVKGADVLHSFTVPSLAI